MIRIFLFFADDFQSGTLSALRSILGGVIWVHVRPLLLRGILYQSRHRLEVEMDFDAQMPHMLGVDLLKHNDLMQEMLKKLSDAQQPAADTASIEKLQQVTPSQSE